jgi:hypothetical protein
VIIQPRPLLFAINLAAIGLLVAFLLVPSPEFLWHRLDPVGYSIWRVRHATFFTAPYRNDINAIEDPIPAWRVIMRTDNATDLLDTPARQPNPQWPRANIWAINFQPQMQNHLSSAAT